MSVEAPTVSIASLAPAMGGGVSVGPSFNAAEFAPISSVSLSINEGPVAPGFLKNTAPLVENVSKPTETSIPSVFLESFMQPVNNPEPALVSGNGRAPSMLTRMTEVIQPSAPVAEAERLEVVRAQLRQAASSSVRPQVRVISENKVVVEPAVEAAEQISQLEEKEREDPSIQENTEVENLRAVIVEAEEVSKVREAEIGEAGQKAYDEVKEEALKMGVEPVGIDGRRMEKFLTEHGANISPIRRGKGLDGSLEQTFKEITSRVFKSVSEIKEAARVVIPRNRPAKLAKEGNILEDREVAKVEKRNIFSPGRSKVEVIVMIFKKRVEAIKQKGQAPVLAAQEGEPQNQANY